MPARKPITVIGGGLAGLTLGIGLRHRSVPVTVFESGRYPRHRVCGEFISGRGQATLARLGLREKIIDAGAIPARTTAFFSTRSKSPVRRMPEPALSISRYAFDALLAAEFRRCGGELFEGEPWRGDAPPEGTVRATGRRAQPVAGRWRWFGLKVHARGVRLEADMEMHLSPAGYVGMSWLRGGEVNICGLFRRPAAAGSASSADWRAILRGAPGTIRHARLQSAEFDESSFCSVAGLSLEPRRAAAAQDCCVGDAITMIPPVTGNGMSMAFESAELAAEPLAAYSAGDLAWDEAWRAIATRCDARFSHRLAWAGALQRLIFMRRLQGPLVLLAPRLPSVWRLLVARTR